jgi:hypothetical protein
VPFYLITHGIIFAQLARAKAKLRSDDGFAAARSDL